jgi:hypothetical protein
MQRYRGKNAVILYANLFSNNRRYGVSFLKYYHMPGVTNGVERRFG